MAIKQAHICPIGDEDDDADRADFFCQVGLTTKALTKAPVRPTTRAEAQLPAAAL